MTHGFATTVDPVPVRRHKGRHGRGVQPTKDFSGSRNNTMDPNTMDKRRGSGVFVLWFSRTSALNVGYVGQMGVVCGSGLVPSYVV